MDIFQLSYFLVGAAYTGNPFAGPHPASGPSTSSTAVSLQIDPTGSLGPAPPKSKQKVTPSQTSLHGDGGKGILVCCTDV